MTLTDGIFRPRVLGPWGDRGHAVSPRIAQARAALAVLSADLEVWSPLRTEAPADLGRLAAALGELAADRYDWLVITSAATLPILLAAGEWPSEHTRIAAVGEVTAAELRAAGFPVALVPEDHSGAGLVAAFAQRAEPAGRVLCLGSAQAAPTVPEGLRALGAEVDVVAAYETVSVEPEASLRGKLRAGAFDGVWVTSGSVARALAGVWDESAPQPEHTRVICLGQPSAREAHRVGLRVDAIAARSDISGLTTAWASTRVTTPGG